ncbi:MAG: 4-hydroxybutyrate coenzyme A transferase, partial [Alphaproteobacteria bacterium]
MAKTGMAEALSRFRPGARVWIAGAAAEPGAALDALAADPELGRGIEFCGIWLPGINRRDPSAGVPGARLRTAFLTPALRPAFADRRLSFHPLHYSALPRWIAGLGLAGAVLQVSPPEAGHVTPGLACDFHDALLASGAALIGQVNPQMPAPPGAPRIPVARFAALVEAEAPLPEYDPGGAGGAELAAIAGHVAGLIGPGDTLAAGIGKAADAVLAALADHRGLALHGGMLSGAAMGLVESGVLARGVTVGVALGSRDFYDRAGRCRAIRWRPVSHTHDRSVLAAIPRLVSVTTAIEIDLLGQVNAESLGGRQVAAHGGAADLARGAAASPGGRAILALPATAAGGRVSRIRPRLDP